MSEAAVIPQNTDAAWVLPSRGIVGMACLITAEAAIFIIFIVAYLYYLGKSISGPTPSILEVPILTSICLLSSSATVHAAVSALHHGKRAATSLWLAATVLLGGIFLAGTAREWYQLYLPRRPHHTDQSLRHHLLPHWSALHATHVVSSV